MKTGAVAVAKKYSGRFGGRVMGAVAAAVLLAQPAAARPVEFDDATVAEIDAAFTAGTLTSEKLVEMCLARIAAYDHQGPKLHAVITLNPKALETARALDAERKAKGPRSALHGIPVVLKDNYGTADMQTSGGSVLLEGAIPPEDAFVVQKLRAAGAIILAKVNLSEFASTPAMSSLGGQSLNPHDLTRTPAGSSGGVGVSIAAGYAPLGMGTDTGGSIRNPSTANGIVGLKPTYGLLSRNGIIPLALSLDTGGPMVRNVADAAVMVTVMAGVDPADAVTRMSEGKAQKDYTAFLKADSLKGARIGVVRDFMGFDDDVDWAMGASFDAMRKAGATLVDVRYPAWLLTDLKEDSTFFGIMNPEFKVQIGEYLTAKTGPKYPKSLDELIQRGYGVNAPRSDGGGPNPGRWLAFEEIAKSPPLTDYRYTALRDYGLPMIRAVVEGVMAENKLDAIVYPTAPRKTALLSAPPGPPPGPRSPHATSLANLTGFPDLIVPAGFSGEGLPIGISFFGPAFSEPKLFALGYAFEQTTRARRRPVHTPALENAKIDAP